ncbi:MAG: DUF2807 domain-containing protein [Betaproteobacteria bacterium]|nr:DUF2807 domain-containing protein [Betaproteobacteria bacterium]
MTFRNFAAGLALIAVALALPADSARAAGEAGDRIERSLPPITSVSLQGAGELIITQGDRDFLVIEGAGEITKEIKAEVKNGRLVLANEREWGSVSWDGLMMRFSTKKPGRHNLRFHLTIRDLKVIEISGAGQVRMNGFHGDTLGVDAAGATKIQLLGLKLKEFKYDAAGASKAVVAGETDTQSVDLAGASNYEAAKLDSRLARIDIAGSGKAELRAREKIDASIAGVGKIDYYGDPKVNPSIAGLGRIRKVGP